MMRWCKTIPLDGTDFHTCMHEVEIFREWTEIALIEIHSVFCEIEKSVFEFCFEVFRDKSLDDFPFPLCDRLYDEVFLTLCSKYRIFMSSILSLFFLKNRSKKSSRMFDMRPKTLSKYFEKFWFLSF